MLAGSNKVTAAVVSIDHHTHFPQTWNRCQWAGMKLLKQQEGAGVSLAMAGTLIAELHLQQVASNSELNKMSVAIDVMCEQTLPPLLPLVVVVACFPKQVPHLPSLPSN